MQTAGSFARANSTASATTTPSDQVTGRPPSMTDEVDTKQLKGKLFEFSRGLPHVIYCNHLDLMKAVSCSNDICVQSYSSVAELREALSSRGLSVEGRKPELMARLQPVLNSERTAMSAAVQEHAANQLPQQQQVELAPEEVVAKVVALQEAVALDEVAEAAVAEAVDFIQSGAHHPVAAHGQRVVAVGGQKRQHEDVIMADVFDATEHTSDATAETTINNQAEIQQSCAVTATTTAVSAQRTPSSSAIHQTTSTSWDTQFTKLKQYKSLHGNTKIPKSYPPDPSLGRWVNTQRYKNNTNQLNHVKKAKLDAIGFEWNLRNPNRPWKKWIKELQEYKLQYGHVDVPQRDPNHKELGAFVSNLRGEYRKYNRGQTSSLDPKRIHSLEEMGFHWSTGRGRGKISWETRVSQLKHYKEKFGDFNVPKGWVENVGLGDWVEKQRMVSALWH